ncbi:polyketide synthase 12 [Thermocatellispora tengchongensis]|uniref:Polyketide synthase 12 n=1 Tax=Thermocatellispora tengchongensis TaxID=1073253 RepID=A0A840PIY9_9ACTN|nr:SDR family NAD(P)-dependent oxidoreductase [Thermocatellispora tengchongensis]MBB5137520.1 polyketide synthase 12 [Thermocatellispora tengchongensis]
MGVSCRLPGAATPADLWRLLRDGRDAIGPMPPSRRTPDQPDDPGPAGWLDSADLFDPDFFGISPREAAAMDPQQRLVLELAWEALEDAGLVAAALAGTRTGVVIGAISDDYARLQQERGPAHLTRHTVTGLSRGVIANRVSYTLGLRGPSITLDTGQSSSLVAVHLAADALRRGESDLALAGGVNLNLGSAGTLMLDRFGVLSPDRRCHTFDERANGFVRGEGGAVVVLKRLADAMADGDPVYCLIHGGAVNNDGGGDGLTVPDPAGQRDVLRLAYRRAGIAPAAVQYVELHGAGTRAGDPVEAAALGAVLGAERPPGSPLRVGSVKTNLGHLEGAAGVAGLLKVILSIRNRELPPSLNFRTPPPDIPLGELNLRVQTALTPWPDPAAPLVAGVSSIGMGGTNCHLVLAEAPPAPAPAEAPAARRLFPLSARTEDALRAQAAALSRALDAETGGERDADIAYSLATGRTAFGHRAVVTARDRDGLRRALDALAEGRGDTGLVTGHAAGRPPLAMMFTGQGAQRPGMGREAYERFPVFAEALDDVLGHLDPLVREAMWSEPGTAEAALLDETAYTQPALFALEVALFRLISAWGVEPGLLIGHSVGELAAAHAAGVLTLPDACALVSARGRLMQDLPGTGAMAAVQAGEDEMLAALAGREDRVVIGAINGPSSLVVSGDEDAVAEVVQEWRARGRKTRRLRISVASHSPHVDPMLGEFRRLAETLTFAPPRVPVVSNLTGELAGDEITTPGYWVRHVRHAVRFHDGVRRLEAAGIGAYVEVGPDAVLSTAARESVTRRGPRFLPLMRRGRAEEATILAAVAELHAGGTPVHWPALFDGDGARRVSLPTYPFQRRRCWLDGTPSPATGEPVPETDETPPPPEPSPEPPPAPAATPAERWPAVREEIGLRLATVLGHESPGAVETHRTFRDLGLDSMGAVELRDRLAAATGLALPDTILFDHPTPEALTARLRELFLGDAAPGTGPRAETGPGADPIAIVGMACRFPGGVASPEDLWRLVADGTDAITGFPRDRGWDLADLYDPELARPGTASVRTGGFLDGAAGFDAGFFGISPREALAMDPQQRLLLETSFDCLQHAGVDPAGLRGGRVGVFVGATSQEYGPRMHEGHDAATGYVLTGTTPSVASGRIAYTFGFEGPAVTVDTACSASLVALHLACQSLRAGECSLALAGGVTVMSTPGMFIEMSRQRGLAPDGRCKPFAAAADGTGWAEGVGVLLVERLSDARRNGHRVLAVVRGSAINQDGASNGLTAPNGLAQQRVVRQALANAGLSASDVDAVEAHGTGTRLGDPIEAQALLTTYGQGRERPLWLGSVKSNIGHAQAAAGVAGVIKMVMAMRHGVLPKTLHVDEPSPHVDWSAGAVELLTEARAWESAGPRRAGVSSFGISGTNAHVIVEEAPEVGPVPVAEPVLRGDVVPLVLSGRDDAGLRAVAGQIGDVLAAQSLSDVAWSLLSRPVLDRRAVVLAAGRDAALAGLAGVEPVAPGAGKAVFVFPGQGWQWAGMTSGLLDSSPVFAEAMAECERALGVPVTEILRSGTELERVDVVQPVLFAVMVSLARLWRACGVEPKAVVGHSQGEVAAACVAGALSLEDAARVVVARSRAVAEVLSGRGGMAVARMPLAEAEKLIAGREVEIAAVNGPAQIVLSGAVDGLVTDERVRRIGVDYASHCAQVEAIRDRLLAELADITPRQAGLPMWSTVTGGWVGGGELDAAYWYANLRRPVRFGEAIEALTGDGFDAFVEVSAHPVLAQAIEHPHVIPTLRRDSDRFIEALARAHGAGIEVDWRTVVPPARQVELPPYPFQRERYWLRGSPAADAAGLGVDRADHPLLGARVALAGGDQVVFTGRITLTAHPWLGDHAVGGAVVLPGAALAEMVARAGEEAGCGQVAELTLHTPLAIPADGGVQVQVLLREPGQDGAREVLVHARGEEEAEWVRHAVGVVEPARGEPDFELGVWPPPDAEPIDVTDFYDRAAGTGYQYGPAFQGIRAAWRRGGEIHAEIAVAEDATGFLMHPALLDAAVQAVLLGGLDGLRLPFAWTGLSIFASGATAARVRVTPTGANTAEMAVADAAGRPLAVLKSLEMRETAMRAAVAQHLYGVDWTRVEPARASGRWALLGDGYRDGDGSLAGVSVETRCAELGELTWTPDVVLVPVLPGPGSAGLAEDARAAVHRVNDLVRAWLADERFESSRLVLVTRGAVAAGPDAGVADLVHAPIWGFIRSAQSERPGRFTLLDIDGHPADVAGAVATGEPQIAVRSGDLLVPRLARIEPGTGEAPRPDGAVLVTGGTGTLGGLLARHLVTAHGVRHLVLTGRRGMDAPGAERLLADLTELGAGVTIAACDVADRDELAALLDRIRAERPLSGVVHAAGVVDDGLAGSQSRERLDRVLRPKLDAAVHLHELTMGDDLAFFHLFSSASGVLGNAGQAGYAAANAFLDALAHHRRARGLPAISLAWGLWEPRSAMSGHLDDAGRARMRRTGLGAVSAEEGLALYDAAVLGQGRALAVPTRVDFAVLRRQARAGETPALLRGLVDTSAAPRTGSGIGTASGLLARLAELPDPERRQALLDLVRTHTAVVLGRADGREIESGRAFKDLGLDSLTAVELRNRLNTATGRRLPATLVFDHPTPVALADALYETLVRPADGDTPAVVPAGGDDAIAIVGMACRYPGGVASPEDLWRLVADGGDAVGAFPTDRGWDLAALFHPDPGRPGTSHTREGGFLYDAAEFDADFFGISPREALAMDPQQRLLLETSWEVFERAGIDIRGAKGTPAGVFMGVMYHDYTPAVGQVPEDVEGHVVTGGAASVVSGRVAYTFGFEGPAVTVDTACSSSLVALHLASQSLRAGECHLALAGGVTVMAGPATFVSFSRQQGLAPDGRCKSFAAAADGTGWAEGAGVLLLERLSDARRNGHRVLAVIRGSAINQDGASNGLTAPNGPSQQRVIRQALANAGLSGSDVDAVEAHGTGTTLGDPIEAQALLATYGQGRERPLWLGSVKSNIGHAQAAAGVAGVIKMVMAMRHGVLPRTLHVDEPTPHVDWSAGSVELLTEARAWESAGPRRAGVSSFGISGTNAHVIVEEAPEAEPVPVADPVLRGDVVPLVLSGRDDAGLRAVAERVAGVLAREPVAGVAWSLLSRPVLDRRAVVLAADREAALAGLAGVEPVAAGSGKAVFVFPGQGWQWAGMTAGLLDASPVFAAAMAECEQALDLPVTEILRSGAELERVDVVQPVLFAVMVSLARLWRACGVEPRAVVGHSQGEVAAACVAGALSLEDAARVVVARSRAVAEVLSGKGGMAVARMPLAEAEKLIAGRAVEIAAVNGPAQIVLSGAVDDLLTDERVRRIGVDYASHCAQVEAIQDRLLAELADITPRQAGLPMWSTVTGGWMRGDELDAEYWYANLRRPVRFGEAIGALTGDGFDAFVEVSAHPVLTQAIEHPHVIPTLRRDSHRFVEALARAHTAGIEVDWRTVVAPARQVELPTYPFQRERYWLRGSPAMDAAGLGVDGADHPLLGAKVTPAGGEQVVFTGRITLTTHPWLADHAVGGVVVLPGAALAEMVLRAGEEAGCTRIAELTLHTPLTIPADGGVQVQVLLREPDADGAREVEVHGRTEEAAEWVCHAVGLVEPVRDEPEFDVSVWPPQGAEPVDVTGFYDRVAEAGYHYGPAFQGLTAAWRRGEEVFAEIAVSEDVSGFLVHPTLLDAAMQAVLLGGLDELRLPYAWAGFSVAAIGATAARVRITPSGGAVSVAVADASGRPLAALESLTLRPVRPQDLAATGVNWRDSLFRLDWTPADAAGGLGGRWMVVGEPVDGLDAQRVPDLADVVNVPDVPDVLVMRAPARAGVRAVLGVVLERVRRWLAEPRLAATRLVVVTRNAVACPDADPVGAAVWGFMRSVAAEAPGRVVLVDADDGPVPWDRLGDEPEVAVRGGEVLCPRLAGMADALVPPDGDEWRIDTRGGGSLDGVGIVDSPRAPLEPRQVRLAVRAAGVNFRDVILGLDVLPDQRGMGSEAAGVVIETGPGVSRWKVGDRVMGFVSEAFGPVGVADERVLAAVPDGWSFEQAAAVPVAFVTAMYGLVELGGLRAGERVLVHAAAGGVGMAAVQIARWVGARVVGTASEAKWPVLRSMGFAEEEIASSRSAAFEALGPVDVVLNCLSGELVDVSARMVRPGGRFLEMGKTDIRDAAAFPGIRYRAFTPTEAGPDVLGRLLERVMGLFAAGTFSLPPLTVRDLPQVRETLRWMSQAGHVGKVVLRMPRPLDPGKTVLITGGTGTLGTLLARHLVTRYGVRKLLLVSRSGRVPEGLNDLDADIRVAACDVADRAALAEALEGVELTGVIHAAGVVDDGLVTSLDAAAVDRVLRPKADGLANVAELAGDVAWFVAFSSVAGVVGSAGQAGYAAANAFVDAYVARRRAAGLPGVSLAWGFWRSVSSMTGHLNTTDVSRLARRGIRPMSDEHGLALFDAAIRAGLPVQIPARLDPAAIQGDPPPVLRGLVAPARRRARHAAGDEAGHDLVRRLAALPETEHESALTDLVKSHIATVLGHRTPGRVDAGRGFLDLGFDSLTAVELRNRLNAATGLRLPSTVLFDHPTPAALARHLRSVIAVPASNGTTPLFAELERLEQAVLGAGLDGDVRARFGRRLQALLWKLGDPATGGPAAGPEALMSASDEEMYALIDEELGLN